VEGRRLSLKFWHRLYRREFAYWQLHNWPDLSTRSVRTHYEGRQDWGVVEGPGVVQSHPRLQAAGFERDGKGAAAEAGGAVEAAEEEGVGAEVGAGEMLRRWQGGTTGFPMVDAAMRRLWATGWMHQTERMIAAT
jgi:deoxyribodipyrimidine photo-lyase